MDAAKYIAHVMILFAIIFAAAGIAHASVTDPIVPCGNEPWNLCNSCHLVQLGNNVLNFAVYAAVFVAAIMFVYAGVLYISSPGVPAHIQKAHGIFADVAIGLVVVLAGWLIIDTVMKTLYHGSPLQQSIGQPWKTVNCTDTTGIFGPREEGAQEEGRLDVIPTDSEGTFTHVNAVAYLRQHGIDARLGADLNATGGCIDRNKSTCTSLEGMRKATLDEIIAIKGDCEQSRGGSCRIQINAGTETGHASGSCSHGNGCKVDLNDTPELLDLVRTNFSRQGTRGSDGAAIYVNEERPWVRYYIKGDHIDIAVHSVNASTPL